MAKSNQKIDVEFGPTESTHFYASSASEFMTDSDPVALIKRMQTGLPFVLFFVPCAADASYRIRRFIPDVPGTVRLCSYGFDKYVTDEQPLAA